jgi:DNA-binding Lrp family transcriptional regulator
MDEKNNRLIGLLRQNAREPIASIARKLGLSRTAVQERINKLEASGAIAGYTVRLGLPLLRNRIQAHVMIEVNPKLSKQVVTQLSKVEAIYRLYAINGQFDLLARIAAPDTESLDRVLDQIGEIEGIEKTLSSIVLSTKFAR